MSQYIDTRPLLQQVAETMGSYNLYIFGDLMLPFEEHLRRLLHIRDNETLQSFFAQIAFAFRHEFSKLPRSQQDWFPNFTTLVDLLSKLGQTDGTPALRFALLCVAQIGQFIGYYGKGSRPYPNATNSYILGLCTGSFAASAISTSQTLSELVPAGIEAALVAFRTGLRSLELRNAIERSNIGEPQCWSVILSAQEVEAVEIIESFNIKNGLPATSRPYLSSVAPTNVTISGPPSVLKELQGISSLKLHFPSIHSPYHAPHIFDSSDIDEILGYFHDEALEYYKPRIPLLSAASGEVIAAGSLKELLRKAVSDTLCEQIRWDSILRHFEDPVFETTAFNSFNIFPVLSNAAQLLSTSLSRSAKTTVTIHDALNTANSAPQPARPTGKFDQSKIAITGFSGRFPEAASNEEFWQLLRDGRDVHRTIPPDRFNWKTHFDATGKKKNTSKVQYGCFINDPGLFDARFFNMSPRECQNTDPAQRLAITVTYEAMEMAGMVPNRTPSTQQDRIGVFFGVTSDDWREVNSGQDIDTYFIPGGNRAFVPGRISYFYRFSGPSLSIDTACSSSLAAIQTACSSLWRGDCDTAVAGGTNVLTNPDNFAGLDRGHFLSKTGNCNAFDDEASGYCRADAVGAVILKRLEDAEADGDPIFGVIRGSYTNHCGQTDSITRPHEGDQLSVFQRVMRHADANPLDVSYIEMHGTGTQAGDATEMKSVLLAFAPGHDRMPHHPLYLGSAKANIGHAESASGVSSLIKILMMMKMNEIPPHCGIKTKINHNYPLDLNERNVNIALKPTPWRRLDSAARKRAVFLNNFSAAGGNTALLLEDPLLHQQDEGIKDPRAAHPIAVTAKTLKSLKGNIAALVAFLERNPEASLSSLSYTTTARRAQHNYRVICSVSDIQSLLGSLKAKANASEILPIPIPAKVPKIVFVFTGQGSIYAGIGKQLFESSLHFKADIIRFDRIAQQQGFPSFLPLVDGRTADIEIDDIEPVVTHLAHSCVQMAMCRLWASWGVRPALVIGHSLGEYAALYSAGVLAASDAIYLVGTRAELLSKYCSKGTHAMLHIKTTPDATNPYLTGFSCAIACVNQPTGTVISGPVNEIDHLMAGFASNGYDCVKLDVPFAFHSAQVDPILEVFQKAASSIRFNAPSIPFASPLLGRIISDRGELGASYLARACRGVVNFQSALEATKSSSMVGERTIWLEIGPHPICSGMVKGTLGSQTVTAPSLRKSTDTWKVLVGSLELLYVNGIDVQWDEYHRDFKSSLQVLELPRYSWDLRNYWIDYRNDFCLTKGDAPVAEAVTAVPVEQKRETIWISPSVQRVIEEHNSADVSTLIVESNIHDPRLAFVIQGHRVNGAALCPSSLYADIAMTMVNYMLKANGMDINHTGLDVGTMKASRPLVGDPNGNAQLLRVSASADWSAEVVSISFFSVNALGRKIADHATCLVRIVTSHNWLQEWRRSSYLIKSRINSLCKGVDSGESHKMKTGIIYKLFSALVDYDSKYKGIQEVVLDSHELEATARVSFQVGDEGFYFNPCWIDSLGHIAGFIMNGNDNVHSKDEVFINHGWDAMRCSVNFARGKIYQTYCKMQLESGTMYAGDTYVLDEGVIVAVFEGVKFQGVPRQVLDQLLPSKSGASKASKTSSIATERPPQTKPLPTKVASSEKSTPQNKLNSAQTSTKSSNDIIFRALAIIAEEAGLDMATLESDNDFADFGIDSLLSLTISGRIQEELGLDLQSTMFTEYPTIKELTTFLNGGNSYPLPKHASSDEEQLDTPADTVDSQESDATSLDSVTPDGDVMAVIRSVIAEETGMAAGEVSSSTVLAEIGMDSLLGLTIVSKLVETLDIEFPHTLFQECETLKEIENALGLGPKERNGNTAGAVEPHRLRSGSGTDISQAARKDSANATSVLLQGNLKKSNKILFLFPDGSGSATSYASLPKISLDVAVYGLNCPWIKTPQDMRGCSLEDMTTKYLTEIRRRQPNGPYYFGGWSAGGICAYEAAQQLAKTGEETARLILIDSPNPVGLENPPQRMYDFFESLGIFGMNGKKPPSWLRPHFDAFISTLDNYEVKPFAGPPLETRIVYARDGICKHPSDPRPELRPDDPREMLWLLNNRTDFSGSGWAELVGAQNLRIQVLDDVNHFSMVESGPRIQDLASFIKLAME